MLDMNSLNSIAHLLKLQGNQGACDVLLSIQAKATALLDEVDGIDNGLTFAKTTNVTNTKNVLVQIPKAVVGDWGLKVGDTLHVEYKNGKVTVKPNLQRRSRPT